MAPRSSAMVQVLWFSASCGCSAPPFLSGPVCAVDGLVSLILIPLYLYKVPLTLISYPHIIIRCASAVVQCRAMVAVDVQVCTSAPSIFLQSLYKGSLP